MNYYIHELQRQVSEKTAEIEALQDGIRELEAYLVSAKFHEDTTVQARDVLHRLAEITANAFQATF